MALKRCVLEMGMGVDLHGMDYTKAAQRAVFDAIWHNSLGFSGVLGKNPAEMYVHVVIAVTKPEQVDLEEVLKILPHGQKSIDLVYGGLEIPNEAGTDTTVMANAAVIVSLDI